MISLYCSFSSKCNLWMPNIIPGGKKKKTQHNGMLVYNKEYITLN